MRPDISLSILILVGHFVFATLLLRHIHSLSPVKIHIVSGSVFAIGFILLGLGVVPIVKNSFNVWPGLSLIAFGWMTFLFAYSGIYKSISLRLLVELAESYPNSLITDQLYQRVLYTKFTERLDLLESSGAVSRINNKYAANKKSKLVFNIAQRIRNILGFNESTLYFSNKK